MSVQNDASDVRVSYCDAKVYVYNKAEDTFTCKNVVRDDHEYDNRDMEGIVEDKVRRERRGIPPIPSQD